MNKIKLIALCLIPLLLAGCWNYREVDEVLIVAGCGVDRDAKTGEIVLYTETVELSGGSKEPQPRPKLVVSRGETVFDAMRSAILSSGKRLYWAHAQTLIVSQTAAQDGLVRLLDLFLRNAEPRYTMDILVARDNPVKDFFSAEPMSDAILSFHIHNIDENEIHVSKAPRVELFRLVNMLTAEGHSAYAPCVSLVSKDGKKTVELCGTALFSGDALTGYLDAEDTKYFLFSIGRFERGVLSAQAIAERKDANVSLEVFSNRTELTPEYRDGTVTMRIKTETDAAITEIGGHADFADPYGRGILKKELQHGLEQNILRVIRQVQQTYGVDVFNFGSAINNAMPDVWSQLKHDWNDVFKTLDVQVESKIDLRNSGYSMNAIEVGS